MSQWSYATQIKPQFVPTLTNACPSVTGKAMGCIRCPHCGNMVQSNHYPWQKYEVGGWETIQSMLTRKTLPITNTIQSHVHSTLATHTCTRTQAQRKTTSTRQSRRAQAASTNTTRAHVHYICKYGPHCSQIGIVHSCCATSTLVAPTTIETTNCSHTNRRLPKR